MGFLTGIEWTDHTWNPWEGCTKVSPGCLHCYAETRNARWNGGTAPNWGKGAPRRRTSMSNWAEPIKWNAHAKTQMRRSRVFCASLADWLDDEVPIEWLADLLTVIFVCPNLDWQLLTKRPQNFTRRMNAAVDSLRERHGAVNPLLWNWLVYGTPPDNIWIGTTIEDQTRLVERLPELVSIPAKIRFVSMEPLLSFLDFGPSEVFNMIHGIHWGILGGESGPCARPMNPYWARSVRDQFLVGGVPLFFKQWGEWSPSPHGAMHFSKVSDDLEAVTLVSGDIPNQLATRMYRVGKLKAGRMLDGVDQREFPKGVLP